MLITESANEFDALRDALVDILTECFTKPGKFQLPVSLRDQAQTLARDWFKDEQGKKRVAETLNQSGLDEYAIEGEAIRRSSCGCVVQGRFFA